MLNHHSDEELIGLVSDRIMFGDMEFVLIAMTVPGELYFPSRRCIGARPQHSGSGDYMLRFWEAEELGVIREGEEFVVILPHDFDTTTAEGQARVRHLVAAGVVKDPRLLLRCVLATHEKLREAGRARGDYFKWVSAVAHGLMSDIGKEWDADTLGSMGYAMYDDGLARSPRAI